MFDFDELSGEENAEPQKDEGQKPAAASQPPEKLHTSSARLAPAKTQDAKDKIKVVLRHAINEWELTISLPESARFIDVKRALSKRFLQDADAPFPGQLVRKEGGVYSSYKDKAALGSVSEVLLAGFEPSSAPSAGEVLHVEELLADREAEDPRDRDGSERTLETFLALQKALRAGFSGAAFQDDLRQLRERCDRGELKKTKFLEQRQKLFLTVQSDVLPRFGYEGTSLGVYKMMGDMNPYVQEAEFIALANEINALLGIDYSPPDTWTTLSDNCQKLNDDKDLPSFKPEARRAKPDQRRSEFRPPLGLLGPAGVPSLLSGKPIRLPETILQGPH
mmetsp:Transcript_30803/g.57746  ORF Transcript_30803/g.57746 Transcript_30803/m.57746 type:complete len:335 (+) Transcript_30803:50-1054(+)